MNYYKTNATGESVQVEQSLVKVVSTTSALSINDSGSIIAVATDAIVITLPATKAGVEYTFINTGADGNNIITISPQSTDGISGVITLAGTVVARAGTVNVDLVNTKATSKIGSTVTIIGTGVAGVTAWVIKGSTGIWA
tara:strand:- start:2166 stop:2582 length:417 start_codon:yes stop_codon:yes gene_type:complete